MSRNHGVGRLPRLERAAALHRANYTCAVCGRRPPQVRLEIDHIIDLQHGGTHDPDNLQALCPRCHQAKHGSTATPDPPGWDELIRSL